MQMNGLTRYEVPISFGIIFVAGRVQVKIMRKYQKSAGPKRHDTII